MYRSLRGSSVGKSEFHAADHDLGWTSLSRTERAGAPTDLEKLRLSSGEHPRPNFKGAADAEHPAM
jgi:hypothetical protein